MCVDHTDNRLLAELVIDELHAGDRRILGAGIDDEITGVADDDRHVRDAETANLIDSVADLEQAVYLPQDFLTPQARIDAVRRGAFSEVEAVAVPHDLAVVILDDIARDGCDQSTLHIIEGLSLRQWQIGAKRLVGCSGQGRSGSGRHIRRCGLGGT